MKAYRALLIVAASCFALPTTAASPQSANQFLRVEATPPFIVAPNARQRDVFRMAFRIYASGVEDLPITTVRYDADPFSANDEIFGWGAISLAGTTCLLKEGRLRGIGAFGRYANPRDSIPELDTMYEDYPWTARPGSATLITADFQCDSELSPQERFNIQIRFYVKRRGRWYPADYAYEETLQPSR